MLQLQSATSADPADPGAAAVLSLARSGRLDLDLTRWTQLQEQAEAGDVAVRDVPLRDLDLLARALEQQSVISITLASAGELVRLLWAGRYVAATAAKIAPALNGAGPLLGRLATLERALVQAGGVLADLPPGAIRWATTVACGLVGTALHASGGDAA